MFYMYILSICILFLQIGIIEPHYPGFESLESQTGSIIISHDTQEASNSSIQPYLENEWYWQYKGEPVFLIGGGDDDNLFQWDPDKLIKQLDLLTSNGGNFVRNTLSTRDENNRLPFVKKNERFELSLWNQDFWNRFEYFLKETSRRDIIVQLTLWDQHDLVADRWNDHYWNPKNNSIGLEASGIYDDHAFFSAVKDRNALVLPYQQKYIEKVLSYSLKYDHVLYNITNEGWAGLEWEVYWANYITKHAKQQGKHIEVTTMEHGPGLSVDAVLKYPSVFSYIEVSQNNNYSTGYKGKLHWEHVIIWREEVNNTLGPRPFVNEKIYGAPGDERPSRGTDKDAIQRFWRNAFSGCSAVRFHRPGSGLGLSEQAQKEISAMRLFLDDLNIFISKPAPDLIVSSSDEEAYCLLSESGKIAIYLPYGGKIALKAEDDEYNMKGLLIEEGTWSTSALIKSDSGNLKLNFPESQSSIIMLSPN